MGSHLNYQDLPTLEERRERRKRLLAALAAVAIWVATGYLAGYLMQM